MRTACFASCLALLFASSALLAEAPPPAAGPSRDEARQNAQKLMKAGNYKEAYDLYQKLATDPDESARQVGQDLEIALTCLQNLNRVKEADAFREKVAQVHAANWRALYAVARSYFNIDHSGTIVAGKFERGPHRGGGKYANVMERDRVRALQLMVKAMEKAERDFRSADQIAPADRVSGSEIASFYEDFARQWMGNRGYNESWRLQYLSDLTVLPDYEEGYWYYRGGGASGAPVDEAGNPVLHLLPKTFADAKSDGERWRWCLTQAMEYDAGRADSVRYQYAEFLHQQFGVQTMAAYGWPRPSGDGDEKAETGTYALHTLAPDETIARLATGVKRFRLPAEFDFIRIFGEIGRKSPSGYAESALNTLAQIYMDRRQYVPAEETWRLSIKNHGPGHDNWKQKRLDQIVKNWGRFEPIMTQPAGEAATVEYRFRNASKVTFDACEIKVANLLGDIKDYLKSNPRELDWQRMNVGDIGYMLVTKDQSKYLGKEVARWDLALEPKTNHFDRLITVKTPLKKAGAYLLTATLPDGNVCKIILWLNDTVIVRKNLDQGAYFFVADAVTGQPLPKVNIEFFGYRQEGVKWEKAIGRHYNVLTTAFAEYTDADGQVRPAQKDFQQNYQWIVSATTEEGRLAYLGFTSVWYGRYYDQEYNQRKVFGITDRPVYRPAQPVKFKFWIREAKYDQEDTSSFAKQDFAVIVNNPRGEKVFEKTFTTDAYGGLDGEFSLPKDAQLGQYYAYIWQGGSSWGGIHFRVEEYKKPEFEVNVEAPTEPVMLGETITATIKAKYYFGAPVQKAKVKYKVMRSDYSANWYPAMPWDWFYGSGYWWFAYDYTWYPRWDEWGCKCPRWWWWPASYAPPEIVAENEVPIGPDGVVKVTIDTKPAAELHGDTDHKYTLSVEVTDDSRRTITGDGTVLVARKPFKVYAWVDRGHYRPGDVITASFSARTLDSRPVKGKGALVLYRIQYKDGQPVEKAVQEWDLNTDDEGLARQLLKASEAGQYRLAYTVTDEKRHKIEGAYLFVVRGEGFDGKDFRFNEIELVPDKREYAAGEKVRLMVNTDRAGGTVLLFIRPANGIYLPPKVLRLKGKSSVEEIEVSKKDMPNFFVEAVTVYNGRLYSQMREIVVPPEKRVLNVEVLPSARSYKPGEAAKIRVKLTDFRGQPFMGSTALSVYDKAVEYISGGSNVQEIKAFFWKWRRHHNPATESSLDRLFYSLTPNGMLAMESLGIFGETVVDEVGLGAGVGGGGGFAPKRGAAKAMENRALKFEGNGIALAGAALPAAPMAAAPPMEFAARKRQANRDDSDKGQLRAPDANGGEGAGEQQPAIRKEFADTAYWTASLTTDSNGVAEVNFKMPENLTGWKVRTWAMGHGTKVGEGAAEIVTVKNLLLRLQAPRFFVEKDEVVLSANIHNYLKQAKSVRAVLEFDGKCLETPAKTSQTVKIEANGEQRVDWRVKVLREGEAVIRMKALTDEESDAMEMKFPVYVHGMLKMDSYCGAIRRDKDRATVTLTVPAERRMDETRLEVRYSPTLAGAMVDALPYLVDYPYGCTEQTLNRFLPTVMVQKILKDMGLDLKAIRDKQTNLNAQEIGNDRERAAQWKRNNPPNPGETRNPVFDEAVVTDMVKQGLKALTAMQLSDGGWGWFSGWGEYSWPHTTAYVVHGLQIAKANDVAIVPGVLERGVDWLARYQADELQKLRNAEKKVSPWKSQADNLDAFVFMVLVDAGKDNADMRDFLYRDRTGLSVYAKAMFGLALHKTGQTEQRDMLLRNIEQFLVRDAENQTAYLNLGNESYWWYWYGSENEAHAYYLKLLAAVDPKSERAADLVKYLLNNRKHATYWNSTRDTALCIEAMSDYLRASGEDKPDMTVEIYLDGKKMKEARVTADNLFGFDNKLVLVGDAVDTGKHAVEIRRKGTGPVYFNAYLTNFTLEDFIGRAGLEIKVNRKYYKLTAVDKKIKVAGARGQALDQKVEKYSRTPLANLDLLKSGDLVEVELEIASKNDYEYIVFEDMKAAGFEPVEVRSGYNGNDMGAYVEFRDERVCFFVRSLARGEHSVAYRLRAEIPGRFSALPTKAHAMYAPELKANSDEIKLKIED
jgi:uncharacterized protein YfaS (alpha-2-macroglobulin family)